MRKGNFFCYNSLSCSSQSTFCSLVSINIRYFGILRKHVSSELLSQLLLIEILCRTMKNEIRRMLRENINENPSTIISNYLNATKEPVFWQEIKTKAINRFPETFSPFEMSEEFFIPTFLGNTYTIVFDELIDKLGVVMKAMLERSKVPLSEIIWKPSFLEDMIVKVKYIDFLIREKGKSSLELAKKNIGSELSENLLRRGKFE